MSFGEFECAAKKEAPDATDPDLFKSWLLLSCHPGLGDRVFDKILHAEEERVLNRSW